MDIERVINYCNRQIKWYQDCLGTLEMNKVQAESYDYVKHEEYIDKMGMYKLMKKALEKQLNGGWVPVNVKLPERDSNCLVTTENGEIFTSKFYGYGEECQGFKEFPEGVWEIDAYGEIVIAWQPSPEPWKEGISDGKDYLQG